MITKTTVRSTVVPEPLLLAGKVLQSRLFLGTGGSRSLEQLADVISVVGPTLVTVAVRRFEPNAKGGILDVIREGNADILPNTAGCFSAQDAVLTAKLAREAFETNWVKLEVIGDSVTLLPDALELLNAAEVLSNDDFVVLPYCTDDPVLAKRLEEVGCRAVMPLGSPIGSGQGILNRDNLMLLREAVSVPVILDAGIGTASDAAIAMECGCDGVLIATAIHQAENPVAMAYGLRCGVEAGYHAYRAGRIPMRRHGQASSPMAGRIGTEEA